MNYNFGSSHYGKEMDSLISSNRDTCIRFEDVLKLFRNRYWGDVSSEQWEANNKAIKNPDSREQIVAVYKLNDSTNLHIMTMQERTWTIFATDSDMNNGVIDDFNKRFRENQSVRKKMSTRFRIG